jgi:D-psicose/D-tagatose/L-ribulose 3-epimerase
MTDPTTNPTGITSGTAGNALGVHALVWVSGWDRRQCRHAVAATARSGFDLLEVPLLDPAQVDADMTAGGRANAVAALRTVAAAAHERDVTLGLEPVNRYESNLVNTAEQALDLIADIGADNVVVHLDSYHMHIEQADMAGPVRRCAAEGRLGYVHVGESHRGYLGTGSLDLPGLFRALADVGYAGPIVVESFSSAVVSPAFASALAVWRDLWTDGDDLVRAAHAYMTAHLDAARTVRRDHT